MNSVPIDSTSATTLGTSASVQPPITFSASEPTNISNFSGNFVERIDDCDDDDIALAKILSFPTSENNRFVRATGA